jgi:prolycopene isomerase
VVDNKYQEPRAEEYDVVVVGSGFGGLSAAGLLARAGLSVLLCERADGLGGYGHAFRRGHYTFDPAIRVTYSGGPDGLYAAVLRHLGTADRVEMVEVARMYDALLPDGRRVKAPASLDGLIEANASLFPSAAAGIESFFRMCQTMHEQGHAMPMTLSLRNLDEVAARFPEYFRHNKLTLDEVAREHIDDPEARGAVCASWPYQGAVPSRLGFIAIAQPLMNGAEGTYYSLGGFQVLVDAVIAGMEDHGGEVLVGNGAKRIVVEDGRVAGVVLDSGHELRTPVVVSNADGRQTLLELVGEEHLPSNFLRRMGRLTIGHSAFVAFVGTDLDLSGLDLAHETFIPSEWDQDSDEARIAAGEPAGVWVGIPTLIDPQLAPAGEHALAVSAVAAHDIGRPWTEHADAYCEELLKRAERLIPGLRENLKFLETATPETFVQFTSNSGGAMYGWEQTPAQSGTRRLSHQTPIDGLLLSGQWTLPGSGSLRCFASGVHTAQMVLRRSGAGDALPGFGAANLPDLD